MTTERITIEQLAAYLPYDLKLEMSGTYEPDIVTLHAVSQNNELMDKESLEWYPIDEDIKPILHPFQSIKSHIIHNGDKVLLSDELSERELMLIQEFDILDVLKYSTVQTLLKYHVDIFGLIPKNLAVEYEH